jgi:hypothetical protein
MLDTVNFNRAIMNRAISKGGGMVLDDFSDSNMTARPISTSHNRHLVSLDKSEDKHLGILYYKSRRSCVTPTRWEEEFLSLLQDTAIIDRYSVACGLLKIVDLTADISMQSLKLKLQLRMTERSLIMAVLYQIQLWWRHSTIGMVRKPRNLSFLAIQVMIITSKMFVRKESSNSSRPIGQRMDGKTW